MNKPQDNKTPIQPQASVPNKGELFVGLNVLSKVGVVFIIIGAIAFSAISSDVVSREISMAIIFGLGVLLVGLGEVFVRLKSPIFARALTLGGIAELFISVIILFSRIKIAFDVTYYIIAFVIVSAGIMLSYRYKSQGVLIVTVIAGTLPALFINENLWFSVVYLLLLQAGVFVMSHVIKKTSPIFVQLFLSFIVLTVLSIIDYLNYSLALIVYIFVSFGIFAANSFYNAAKTGGKINGSGIAVVSVAGAAHILFTFITVLMHLNLEVIGELFLGTSAVFAVVMICFRKHFGRNSACIALENMALAYTFLGALTVAKGRYAIMIFMVLAAAVYIIGQFSNIRMFRIWGYITLAFGEFYFLTVCSIIKIEKLYYLQFILTAVIFLGIMVLLAKRGKKSPLFTIYTIFATLNGIAMLIYFSGEIVNMLYAGGNIGRSDTGIASAILVSCIWMIGGFAFGKMRWIGKTAPWVSSVVYFIGIVCLINANYINSRLIIRAPIVILLTIAVNAVSVLCVLDMTFVIKNAAPKFARAVGLVVSAYSLLTLTVTLGSNDILAFTSCIISIIYIAMAIVWISVGFWKKNALLRRFGLALSLLSSGKLFLFDFSGIGAVGRTLMFIGFGMVLLVISFVYAFLEKRLKTKIN